MGPMVHIRRFLLAATLLAPVILAQSASDGRNLFFYFDISTLSKDDQATAISAAEKFVQRQAAANDRIAVLVYGGGKAAVKQDLTSDRDRALHALHHIADGPAQNV